MADPAPEECLGILSIHAHHRVDVGCHRSHRLASLYRSDVIEDASMGKWGSWW